MTWPKIPKEKDNQYTLEDVFGLKKSHKVDGLEVDDSLLLDSDSIKCLQCGKEIPDGEGRYNFPTGVNCTDCGSDVNMLLDTAETLLKIYSKKVGYNVRIKYF